MNIDKAVSGAQDAEAKLAKRLRAISERHAVEHDLYHLGHTLAQQADSRLERLAPFAGRYGAATRRSADSVKMLETLRSKGARLMGRSEISGVLLLRDLQKLYLTAQRAEIAWVILAQTAQAVRDAELVQVATDCHEETETCGKWIKTRIKETAPQVLAPG